MFSLICFAIAMVSEFKDMHLQKPQPSIRQSYGDFVADHDDFHRIADMVRRGECTWQSYPNPRLSGGNKK